MQLDSSSDESDDSFLNDSKDVLQVISNKASTHELHLPKKQKTLVDSAWHNQDPFDLGFDLKVEKPKLPVGFNKDIKTNERFKALNERVKKDEAEALASIKRQEDIEKTVKFHLSETALKNEKYVEFAVRHFDSDTGGLKDVHLFARKPSCEKELVPIIGKMEPHVVTDLELIRKESKKFDVLATFPDPLLISGVQDLKAVKTLDRLSFSSTSTQHDARLKDDVRSQDFDVFIKDIGIDLDLVKSTYDKDLKDLRTLDKFQDIPPVTVSVQRLSLGVNVFLQHKCSHLAASRGAQRLIELKNFDHFYFHILRVVFIALMDSKVHYQLYTDASLISTAKKATARIFDNMIQYYMRTLSKFEPNDQVFKKLCHGVIRLMNDITNSKDLLSRALCCLLEAHTTKITKQVVSWIIFDTVVAGIEGEKSSLTKIELDEILTFENSSGSNNIIKNLCGYLEILQLKTLKLGKDGFRQNLPFFRDLRACFILLEKLIFSNISLFRKMEDENQYLLSSHSYFVSNTSFEIDEETIVPHLLSVLLTQIKLQYFANFDLSANPILGKIMNILGNLIFRLEKELKIKILDLQV